MAAGQEQCADIEGPLGAEVDAFIEQRGPHLGRGHVDEPVAVQHVEDRLLLLGAQGTRLPPLAVRDRRRPLGWRADAVPPVVAGLRRAYGDARIPHADAPGELGDGLVGHGVDLGLVSALSESVSKSACSLPAHPPGSGPWPAPAPTGASRPPTRLIQCIIESSSEPSPHRCR